jgi:hypothetical protein
MTWVRVIIFFFMPTLVCPIGYAFAGHASMYTSELALYMDKQKHMFPNPKIGVVYVSSLSSYKGYAVGGMSTNSGNFMTIDVEYGRLKSFSSSQKFSGSLLLTSRGFLTSSIDSSLNLVMGALQRLSPHYVLRYSIGVPVLSFGKASKFPMIVCGIHYFKGTGISYQERSKELKRVKRRFLWFFWRDI